MARRLLIFSDSPALSALLIEVILMLGKNQTSRGFDKVQSYDPVTRVEKTLGRLHCKMDEYAVCVSGEDYYNTDSIVAH